MEAFVYPLDTIAASKGHFEAGHLSVIETLGWIDIQSLETDYVSKAVEDNEKIGPGQYVIAAVAEGEYGDDDVLRGIFIVSKLSDNSVVPGFAT